MNSRAIEIWFALGGVLLLGVWNSRYFRPFFVHLQNTITLIVQPKIAIVGHLCDKYISATPDPRAKSTCDPPDIYATGTSLKHPIPGRNLHVTPLTIY